MTPKSIKYYDWFNDIQPEILKNLNELLVAEGSEPIEQMHGGYFKDNKWVSMGEGDGEYRNYWHVYLELWGERVRNDSYDEVWFPNVDDEEEWEYLYELAGEFTKGRGKETTDSNWPKHLVTAVRKMLKDNGFCTDNDGEGILIWWCW